MFRSTISTGSYVLAKYSRSYPTLNTASGTGQTAPADQLEWQHFANPVIKLTLDLQKSSTGCLESVRLKILWNMNMGGDSMEVDQREIVLEDIDLLSFSMPSVSANAQGLPLKAVYRDGVVGIRYQHPKIVPLNASPSYRRFQINFNTASAAAEFIDAIRPVCPCKANGAPGPPALPTSSTGAPKSFLPPPPLPAPRPNLPGITRAPATLKRQDTMYPGAPPAKQNEASSSSGLSIASSDPPAPHHALEHRSSSPRPWGGLTRLAQAGAPHFSAHTSSSGQQAAYQIPYAERPPPVHAYVPPPAPSPDISAYRRLPNGWPASTAYAGREPGQYQADDPGSSSLPRPTPPSPSTTAASFMPPPPLPPIPTPVPSSPFLESLRETPALSELTRTELEGLVAQVVREPGFVKLVDSLDSLWIVKGFLAR